MDIDLTIKNYRCFSDAKPVRISLRKGLTSFVGVNNSGKSSILRFFYELRGVFRILASNTGSPAHFSGPSLFQSQPSVFDRQSDIFFDGNNRNLEIEIRLSLSPSERYRNANMAPSLVSIVVPRGTSEFSATLHFPQGPVSVPLPHPTLLNGFLEVSNRPTVDLYEFCQAFAALSDTLYIDAFRNALNEGGKDAYFDIQVGESFIRKWDQYKTGATKSHNNAAFRVQSDTRRIFGFKDLEINAAPDNKTLQVRVDGRHYNLLELGSGLTQFLLVLANAATNPRSYILIDEPELNLHPSLQLGFLTTLGSYASEGVLLATHSVGLARAGGDWRYSIRKNPGEYSEVTELESTPHLADFLSELGFSGYRELGFGKVLLVEGKTDVKAMQQFLRLYGKDHIVVCLPLWGKTLINGNSEPQLSELTRISDDIAALIDSEKAAPASEIEAPRRRFQEICQGLGIRCHIMERRAIENYFSSAALKKALTESCDALTEFGTVDGAWPQWTKERNWRIAREMTKEELSGTDIGRFLDEL